ncbi:MAG: DHH family phosphoesterase [Bacilli bacterium]|jgi:hypothetical protein
MDLEKLKSINHIFIIGHTHPDIDTIVSSKILADIFNFFAIKSDYATLEGEIPDSYNMKMINDCMNYNPVIIRMEDIPNHKYYLVDHNDVQQSVLDKDFVIGCIDHHQNSETIKNAIFTDYCCTALFIYDVFKDKYPFTKEQKKQIYMAFLNDSAFGKSSRCKKKDKELIQALGFDESYSLLFDKYFIPTDLSDNLERVFYNNGHKSYRFGEIHFESSHIERLDSLELEKYKIFIKNYNGNFLGLWLDYKIEKTYAFMKYNDNFKEINYDFIASRATTVLDDILKYLNKGSL